MKTRSLLALGAVVLTAATFNAKAADALLSPRAAANQIKHVQGTSNDPDLIRFDTYAVSLTPPAVRNQQIKHVASTGNDVNPALTCAQNMGGTPKMIQQCAEHTTMPGCKSVSVASVQ